MFNKKSQDVNLGGVLMAIVGFFVAFIMAKAMGAGIVYRIIVSCITSVACYFVASGILRS